ncbi:MAG: 3-deoxy-7-phosphoheptulonate synthase, partial [Oscillospiraceae bacterium]|nr:3-deoxy-7-phosphoheptulonate synthase [Oscillospiraceae bacterium]
MIIVLKQNPEKEKVDGLIEMLHDKGFSTNLSRGESHTIIGLIGDTAHLPIDRISSRDIVESATRAFSYTH